jgi:hypothetical protein
MPEKLKNDFQFGKVERVRVVLTMVLRLDYQSVGQQRGNWQVAALAQQNRCRAAAFNSHLRVSSVHHLITQEVLGSDLRRKSIFHQLYLIVGGNSSGWLGHNRHAAFRLSLKGRNILSFLS